MPGRKQALKDVDSLLEFLIALRERIDAKLEEFGVDDPDTDDSEISDDPDED